MEDNKYFLEFTSNGVPFVIHLDAIFSVNQGSTGGEALVNGIPVDQKFSDIISALESIGVQIVLVK